MNMNLFLSDNSLEVALLRSSLAFGLNENLQRSRSLFLSQVISSLILAKGAMTSEELCEEFKANFGRVISQDAVNSHLDKLTNKKKILKKNKETGKFEINAVTSSNIDKEYGEMQNQTSKLIDEIVDRTKRLNEGKLESDITLLKNKIKDALTYFFRLFSLDLLDRVENVADKEFIVKKLRGNLDIAEADALILSLSQVIDEEVKKAGSVLKKWAKAYVFTQIAQLDPTLNSFELTQFRKKTFILDTEVVLHCLVNKTRFSQEYQKLVDTLLKCQCKVYIPTAILKEVVRHVKTSKNSYYYFKSSFNTVPDEILLSTIANVFVEDFYNTSKQYASFDVYYDNYYDEDAPEELIKRLLHDKFRTIEFDCKVVEKKDEYVIADSEIIDKYIEDIYYETKNTAKGARRLESDNRAIAETDAYIYLGIADKLSEQTCVKNERDILNKDLYFVTTSNRAYKCAMKYNLQRDVCTNPNVLIGILATIGQFKGEKTLKLFENPFLVNAAQETWEDIHNAVEFGLNLKGANVYSLKRKLEKSLKKWIACRDDSSNADEIVQKAKSIGIKKYTGDLYNRMELKKLKEENERLKAESLNKDLTIKYLKKEKAKGAYLSRVVKKK